MRGLVKSFKMLSDETRLRVINLLLERECCVCEVMQALEISQSKASRGLTALYDAGFLKLRKEGLWSLYSIDRENIADYQSKMLDAVQQALMKNEVAVLDKARLEKTRRVGAGCLRGRCAPDRPADGSKTKKTNGDRHKTLLRPGQ